MSVRIYRYLSARSLSLHVNRDHLDPPLTYSTHHINASSDPLSLIDSCEREASRGRVAPARVSRSPASYANSHWQHRDHSNCYPASYGDFGARPGDHGKFSGSATIFGHPSRLRPMGMPDIPDMMSEGVSQS